MFALMTSCGIDKATGIAMLKERKERFEQALVLLRIVVL